MTSARNQSDYQVILIEVQMTIYSVDGADASIDHNWDALSSEHQQPQHICGVDSANSRLWHSQYDAYQYHKVSAATFQTRMGRDWTAGLREEKHMDEHA